VPDDAAVPRGDRLQPGAQARHRLRGQRHLGDQEDHAPAGRQGRLDRPQVDLGLAGAGDPVKQRHPEFPLGHAPGQGLDRDRLLRVEGVGLGGHELAVADVVGVGVALHPGHGLADQAPLDERLQRAGRGRRPREDERLRLGPDLALQEGVELGLRRGAPPELGQLLRGRPRGDAQEAPLLDFRTVADRGRDHGLDDRVHRRRVVARHPAGKGEEVGRQRRERVDDLGDGLQAVDRVIARGPDLPDDAQAHRPPDRDPHQRAHHRARAERLRHVVVQDLVEAGQGVHAHDHRRRRRIELARSRARNPLRAPPGSH